MMETASLTKRCGLLIKNKKMGARGGGVQYVCVCVCVCRLDLCGSG
jgi:hypothetical protein